MNKNDFKQIEIIVDRLLKKRLEVFATKDDLGDFATKDDIKIFATKDDLKNFLTKDDIKIFATKDDLKDFATKDDLKNFPTKDDIKIFATKDDLKITKEELIHRMDEMEIEIIATVDKHKADKMVVEDLEKRVEKLESSVL